jgi:hypothetical protein
MNRPFATIFLGAGRFEGRAPTPSNRTHDVGAEQSPATALSIAVESAIHANSMGAVEDEANADLRPQEPYPTEGSSNCSCRRGLLRGLGFCRRGASESGVERANSTAP